MTIIILAVVDHIPGCALRASEEAEIIGIDAAEVGELGFDFVYYEREVDHFDNHSLTDLKGLNGITTSGSASSTEKKDGVTDVGQETGGPSNTREANTVTA